MRRKYISICKKNHPKFFQGSQIVQLSHGRAYKIRILVLHDLHVPLMRWMCSMGISISWIFGRTCNKVTRISLCSIFRITRLDVLILATSGDPTSQTYAAENCNIFNFFLVKLSYSSWAEIQKQPRSLFLCSAGPYVSGREKPLISVEVNEYLIHSYSENFNLRKYLSNFSR